MIQDGKCRHELRGLGALAALAIALRVAAVFAVGSYRLDRVTYEHGEIARNLVEGRGFAVRWLGADGPTSQQAPVYPLIVAVFYKLFGVQSSAAVLALELFQAVLGGLLVVGVAQLARELLPDRPLVVLLTALGAVIYPTLVYATTQVQVASLATLLVVWVLWMAARARRLRSLRATLGCGIASGLLVLTDPILSLVVVVALLMLERRRHHSALTIRHSVLTARHSPLTSTGQALIALLAAAAVVTPWLIRNYRVHGELVLVKSTFGYAFWQGNHPRSFGTDKIPLAKQPVSADGLTAHELERKLWNARLADTLYIDDAVLSRERIAELGRLPEPERSRQLLAEATDYIRANPRHYVRLCWQRLRYFLLFDETNPKSQVEAYRVSHLGLLVLALVGLWVSRREAKRLWPTYLVFGLVTLFHTLTIVSARFHIPLEPLEIIWAASGLAPVAGSVAAAVAQLGSYRARAARSLQGSAHFSSGPTR